MENDSVKKIKLKNLQDVISENLRIHNEKKLQSTSKTIELHSSEQNINPEQNEPKKSPNNRISVSDEELDVMQLELKDFNAGKKFLKSIRKNLHKEIRDWVLFPFQLKQTDFNQKTFQNFTQAFSELDYNSERIDANLKKFWDLQTKFWDLETKIDFTKNNIDQKLDSTTTKIDYLESTTKKLDQTLDSNSKKINEKLDSTTTNLQQKIDSTTTNLQQKLDSTTTDLQQKLDSTGKMVDQKIISSESKIDQKVADIVDKKNSSIFRTNIGIESSLQQSYSRILERNPDEEGFRFYLNKIKSGETKESDFENVLKQSVEYKDLQHKKKVLKKYTSQIHKPIFIIGVPRTGTTLIYDILCSHIGTAWVSNMHIKNWLSPHEQFSIIQYQKWLKSKYKKIPINEDALFVFGKKLGKSLKQFGTPPRGTSKIPIEGEMLWRKFFGADFVKDIPIDSKIKFAREIFNILDEQEKPRFLCKAPQNSMRLFAIYKTFPDAKFINVIRDPRATVCSMMQRNDEEGQFDMGMPVKNITKFDELGNLEKFAFRYKEISESINEFSSKTKADFLTIRYDELIKNPIKMTQKILKFCQLDEPKYLGRLIPKIRVKTNENWQKKLSKDDEEKIFKILGPFLKKMKNPYTLHSPKKIKKGKK